MKTCTIPHEFRFKTITNFMIFDTNSMAWKAKNLEDFFFKFSYENCIHGFFELKKMTLLLAKKINVVCYVPRQNNHM